MRNQWATPLGSLSWWDPGACWGLFRRRGLTEPGVPCAGPLWWDGQASTSDAEIIPRNLGRSDVAWFGFRCYSSDNFCCPLSFDIPIWPNVYNLMKPAFWIILVHGDTAIQSHAPNKKIVDLTTGFDQKRPFLRLLQLLWGTNEAIAQRLACSLRLSKPEPEFGQSLSQTLSQLATRASSTYLGRFTLAPQVRAPVPAFEFHLQSLAEEKVPPESWSLRIGKGPPVWCRERFWVWQVLCVCRHIRAYHNFGTGVGDAQRMMQQCSPSY